MWAAKWIKWDEMMMMLNLHMIVIAKDKVTFLFYQISLILINMTEKCKSNVQPSKFMFYKI